MRTHTAVRFGGCFLDFCVRAGGRRAAATAGWLAGLLERSGFGAMRAYGSPECRPGASCMREERRAVCVGGEHARTAKPMAVLEWPRHWRCRSQPNAAHIIIAPDRARILDSSSQRMPGQQAFDYIEKVFRQHIFRGALFG